jgi:hypothetical protein
MVLVWNFFSFVLRHPILSEAILFKISNSKVSGLGITDKSTLDKKQEKDIKVDYLL